MNNRKRQEPACNLGEITVKLKAINGFKDILPDQVLRWQQVEQTARDIFERFGMREIRMPILEKTELFFRSIGEATDIVEKEMYSFPDKGITMRPEATASLLRAFIEHGLHVQQPVQRLYTIGPMFRHERPQKGRLRQFHQMDVEVIGATEPQVDAELMAMGQMLLNALGLKVSLEINSLGCPDCRPAFRTRLIEYLKERKDDLCEDCRRRLSVNPLRTLDCKSRGCRALVQEAPSILDSLCSECNEHFAGVEHTLELLGVTYTKNRFMVRGLDYYTRTTFEFITGDLGAQAAVGAGGRYDGLIEQLGGPKLPGIGFAMGMERIVLLMEQQAESSIIKPAADIFVAALGDKAAEYGCVLVQNLRALQLKAAMDYSGRSLKAQMKQAGRINSRFTLIVGDNELTEGKAVLRNMQTQEQETFALDGTINEQAGRLFSTIIPTSIEVDGIKMK
ncbi:MAG TPA: histidine--tRNA ligase [Desulfobulbus sp.]|nr:histidine--tRNA ligase [Desulfobulbus sp.]